MILQSDLIIYNEFFFQFFVLIISFLFTWIICKSININNAKSLMAIHSVILFTFIFIEIIDYMFIIFAIIEVITLIKMSSEGGSSNESD